MEMVEVSQSHRIHVWYIYHYLPISLGGGFKSFLFSPLFGEDFHFDEHIFQMGWFNSTTNQSCFDPGVPRAI